MIGVKMEQWEISRDGIKTYCYLKKQLDKIQSDYEYEQNKLEALEHDEQGVKGVSYDKEPTSGSPNKDLQALKRLDMVEKVETQTKVVEKKKAIVDYQTMLIDNYYQEYISKLPSDLKYQCLRYFGEYPFKMTLDQLAKKFNYSDKSAMLKSMKRRLNKIN